MNVTIRSTSNFKEFDGRFYRMWVGTDDKGQEVVLWVLGLNFKPGSDLSEAERDLRTVPMSGLEMIHACGKEEIGPK